MDREQSHLYLVFIVVPLGEKKVQTSQVMLSDCLPSALTSPPLNDPDLMSSPLIAMFETLASDNASPRPLSRGDPFTASPSSPLPRVNSSFSTHGFSVKDPRRG
jgi:hypothetical protein